MELVTIITIEWRNDRPTTDRDKFVSGLTLPLWYMGKSSVNRTVLYQLLSSPPFRSVKYSVVNRNQHDDSFEIHDDDLVSDNNVDT